MDGRLKATPENKYYYDAAGRTVMVTLNNNRRMIQHLDGEGKAARQDRYNYSNYYHRYQLAESIYFIYSSVLGKQLTEVLTFNHTDASGTGAYVRWSSLNKQKTPRVSEI